MFIIQLSIVLFVCRHLYHHHQQHNNFSHQLAHIMSATMMLMTWWWRWRRRWWWWWWRLKINKPMVSTYQSKYTSLLFSSLIVKMEDVRRLLYRTCVNSSGSSSGHKPTFTSCIFPSFRNHLWELSPASRDKSFSSFVFFTTTTRLFPPTSPSRLHTVHWVTMLHGKTTVKMSDPYNRLNQSSLM